MKPYLINKSNRTVGVERFVDTFPKLGESVEHISYQMKPYWENNPKGTTVIKLDHHFRFHLDKFLDIDFSLLDKSRFIIFTDTSDVIFQDVVPELDDSKEIYVASENLTHNGEVKYVEDGGGYWEKFFKTDKKYEKFMRLMPKMMYNSGVFAMKVYLFKELVKYVVKEFEENNISATDQPIFNYWIHFVYKKPVFENRKLFMCAYKNIDLGLMKKKDNIWVNDKDEIISICHFNGSMKKYI